MKGIPASFADLCGPAVARLSPEAFRLWVGALALVADRPEPILLAAELDVLPRCPPAGARRQKLVAELLVDRLWLELAGGWAIALPSRAELAAKRAAAGRAGGQRSVAARKERFGSAQPPRPEAAPNQSFEPPPKQSFEDASKPSEANTEAGSNQNPNQARDPSPCTPSDLRDSPRISGSSEEKPDNEASAGAPEKKPRRWRRFPTDFVPDEGHVALASECGVNLDEQLRLIRDHEFADPKSDPSATFRNWLRNAKRFNPQQARPATLRAAAPRQPDRGYEPGNFAKVVE